MTTVARAESATATAVEKKKCAKGDTINCPNRVTFYYTHNNKIPYKTETKYEEGVKTDNLIKLQSNMHRN